MTPAPTTRFPRHVLCGIDLEGRSKHAIAVATWLAERAKAELELVHAFPPAPFLWGKRANMPEWVAGTESVGRALRGAIVEALREAPKELAIATQPEAVRFHVSSGHAAKVILERARVAKADLIVLGAHAKHGAFDTGGTARGVLAHAPFGVWVQPDRPRPIRRVLAPVDLSPDSMNALAIARDLAATFGAQVTVLQAFLPPILGAATPGAEINGPDYVVEHLLDAEREEFERTIATFDWRGVPFRARFEEGEPVAAVLAHQDEHDLVVMGTHGRTGLSAAVLGGVAQSVLRSARIPVLALRHARETYLL